ncbi:13314_t:CDS:2 [Dentiscutata heterogama]|uniref:13314_t:CDS:1 n=1 Tax=Dentiscutata heterogama TaxID=1316150 RepID=A0ACA9MVZ8_9GLOM|nr:13314_t:CDS:2 [Dentiscutata heterogama]
MENHHSIHYPNSSKSLDYDNFEQTDKEYFHDFDESGFDINNYSNNIDHAKELNSNPENDEINLTSDILQEITYYQLFEHRKFVIYVAQCCGISQDPTTRNYLMIMNYFKGGSLRQYLNNNYDKLSLKDKLGLLYTMTNGLTYIHIHGLIHKDFHPGNLLIKYSRNLGDICNGLRPNLDIVNIPQLLKSLLIKCWDGNPLLRPKADELQDYFKMWYNDSDPVFQQQYQQIKATEESSTYNNLTYQTHPQAIYTSRLLDIDSKEAYLYIPEKLSEHDINSSE